MTFYFFREGRHEPINFKKKCGGASANIQYYETIVSMQDSELMTKIKNFPVNVDCKCCEVVWENFSNTDILQICVKTKDFFAEWRSERLFKITGTKFYDLYTYSKNKHSESDWNKKIDSLLNPKDFKNEYCDYGKKTEGEARQEFLKDKDYNVIETGLIVSKLNPWLSSSPDGVVFKDGKPTALLEIKCPYLGKTNSIDQTMNSCIKLPRQKPKQKPKKNLES